MSSSSHLVVEKGSDQGRHITIPENGARFGRSSKNDVVLHDAKTSRHHCRFFFASDGRLCVTDLGSANRTLVNGNSVQEVRLNRDDRVTLGDTVLKVVHDGTAPAAASLSAASLDLGLGETKPAPGRPMNRKLLLIAALAVIVLAILAWLPRVLRQPAPNEPAETAAPSPESLMPLEVRYEKVLADESRIFRYELTITADEHIHIVIDDTETTHIRESGKVSGPLLEELAAFINRSGFFALSDSYVGIRPDTLDLWDISMTLDKRTKRVRVRNRGEPEAFKIVRDKLEKFGQVELGLWAVQYPPEKLVEMAEKAYLQALKLFDERDVRYGNLADAIKSLEEADFFLRTIDPKPEFYPDALAKLTDFRAELDKRYIEQQFIAERAIRVGDFEEAARELRILCELIGNRNDERYGEARRKLLEVESRLNVQR